MRDVLPEKMTQYERAFLFPLLTVKCPHCLEITKFGLTEQVAYWIGFLGMKFGRMVEYQITCGGCGYKQFVQKKDYPSWKALGSKFTALSNGEITQVQFSSFSEGLDLPELKELIASGSTWECSCGESNPPNFSECWKCNAPSPVLTVEIKERRIDVGGGHPWEH